MWCHFPTLAAEQLCRWLQLAVIAVLVAMPLVSSQRLLARSQLLLVAVPVPQKLERRFKHLPALTRLACLPVQVHRLSQ